MPKIAKIKKSIQKSREFRVLILLLPTVIFVKPDGQVIMNIPLKGIYRRFTLGSSGRPATTKRSHFKATNLI